MLKINLLKLASRGKRDDEGTIGQLWWMQGTIKTWDLRAVVEPADGIQSEEGTTRLKQYPTNKQA